MLTIDETIKYYEEEADEQAALGEWNDDDVCRECAKEYRQRADWLKELTAYRKAEKEIEQELVNWDDIDNGKCRGLFLATSIIQHYKDADISIKTTLSEIHDIHERIRQCNERYEQRMKELERPVEFYNINGPLKITREEDNNG